MNNNVVKADMPDNLYSMSDEEIIDYVVDEVPQPIPKAKRLNAIKKIFNAVGYDLTNDLKLALLTETEKQLLSALAGGCKTSTAIMKVILKKFSNPNVPINEFLFLVYNKSNVADVVFSYRKLAISINQKLGTNLPVDTTIKASTVHAFCSNWVREYSVALGLGGRVLVSENDSDVRAMMESLITKWANKQLPGDDMVSVKKREELVQSAGDFTSAFEYQLEALITDEEMQDTDVFKKLKVSLDDYQTLKKRYERGLRTRLTRTMYVDGESMRATGYTHAQSLEAFRNLVRDREDVRERIRSNFFYIVIDEVQDISPLMMDIFSYLIPNDKQALFIGDDDQTIYGYRAASSEVILNFKEKFSDSKCKIQLLSMNRRCPENVVNIGREVLKLNTGRRLDKIMKSTGRFGKVEFIPYEDKLSQNLLILDKVKDLHSKGITDIVIAYRNNSSAEIIIDMLKDADIPFNTGGAKQHQPFSYYLYDDIYNILTMCMSPNVTEGLINLWKCTPFKKQELISLLDLSDDGKTSIGKHYSLFDIPIEEFSTNSAYIASYRTIVDIAKRIKTEPLKNYILPLIDLVLKYRYVFKVSDNHDYFVKSVKTFYNSDLNFMEMSNYMGAIKSRCYQWNQTNAGISFSTFHRLKGLEFDEVILIDLANDIFPNDSLEEVTSVSKEQLDNMRDENNRLFYVAVTRTKQNLTLFYDKVNPSRYIPVIEKADNSPEVGAEYLTDVGFAYMESEPIEVNISDFLEEGLMTTSLLEDSNDNMEVVTQVIEPDALSDFNDEEKFTEVKVTNRKWNRSKFGDRFK